jgi:hypothetical protein
VLTGVGDSAVHFMAAVLSSASLPTGVGRMFGVDGYRPVPSIRGDASWMAVPWLDRFSGYVLWVQRHPLALVDVLMDTRFFSGEPSFSARFRRHWEFTRLHAPEVWELGSELDRAIAFVWSWSARIGERAHRAVRVEDVTGGELVDLVRYAGAMHQPWELDLAVRQVRKTVTIPAPQIGWDDLPGGMMARNLRRMAEEQGYV